MARLIEWTDEKKNVAFDFILDKIREGNSLTKILKTPTESELPAKNTFFTWLKENKELANQYACACEDRADAIFDEILDIADETSRDTISTETKEIPNSEWIARSRLRVDARKWVASKLNPKKYGDKTDITTNGNDINISPIEWVE